MSFAGGLGGGIRGKIGEEDEDEEVSVVDEDPFLALQGQASKRLEKIKMSFKGHFNTSIGEKSLGGPML
jgi:hypothetical protein